MRKLYLALVIFSVLFFLGTFLLRKSRSSSEPHELVEQLQQQLKTLKEKMAHDRVQRLLNKNNNSDSKIPWLVIGIPTIPRPKKADYLVKTLNALVRQIPTDESDPFYKKVFVFVLSHERGTEHKSFNEAVAQFSYYNDTIQFVQVPSTFGKPENVTPRGVISRNVVAQSLDIAHFLQKVPKSKYLLFMEDDFELCDNGLRAIHHVIYKSNHRYGSGKWVAIRMSFGLNGIIFPNNDEVVSAFASYLVEHANRRPPDHLFTEFAARETTQAKKIVGDKQLVGYRYNIFHHLGTVSTLRDSPHWNFPKCWDELLVPTVFEVEAFNKQTCPNDDIWPCCVTANDNQRFPGCAKPLYPWIRWVPEAK